MVTDFCFKTSAKLKVATLVATGFSCPHFLLCSSLTRVLKSLVPLSQKQKDLPNLLDFEPHKHTKKTQITIHDFFEVVFLSFFFLENKKKESCFRSGKN
jgi:hypothetical protein